MKIKGLESIESVNHMVKIMRFDNRKNARNTARSVVFKIRQMYGVMPYTGRPNGYPRPSTLWSVIQTNTTVQIVRPAVEICGF